MIVSAPNHQRQYSQEPEIGGNGGNSGNGQKNRGLQPFPPYKKSGNKWEHTHQFQYKNVLPLCVLVITVPTKKRVGTTWERYNPRKHWAFPTFPLFPLFLKSQEHVYASNAGEVAQ
ncbi:hypothetical protein [Pseudomonas fluorescens]|uniref:hypothetical protein n=1 Tax=Pseudomonas fluorescens TaxID=294 RepID=UPI001241F8E3|nr:hypothetical protein [Pseudomonas fluorescens]VVM98946.1 hypothetical protein PS639_03181 [Pseudomonas fluorescens]